MTPILSIRGLRKAYKSGTEALKSVHLDIMPGEIFALLGPNGAGKSTVLNMIAGLIAPSTGTVEVLNQGVRGNPGISRTLGLAGEQEQLYGALTGREFVRLNAILQKTPDPDGAAERAASPHSASA